MDQTCVLGAGSFGTALAQLSAENGAHVRWFMRNADQAAQIQKDRRNPNYLSEFELHNKISPTSNLQEAVDSAELIIVAVPSHAVRDILTQCANVIPANIPIVVAAKGIEEPTLMTMAEVVQDVLGESAKDRIIALSGPSFAKEMMLHQPTAVVLAAHNLKAAQPTLDFLFNDWFRPYASNDVVGVEMGGALKNVMAIAAGAVSGLGLGDNTRAGLITRGVAEMSRIAVAKGAHPMTLAGLAGVGDMILTCTGALSRNRSLGEKIGQGKSLEQALAEIRQVAEGVITTKSAYTLVQQLGVDAPIVRGVYSVLYEGVPARDALTAILKRKPGHEHEYAD